MNDFAYDAYEVLQEDFKFIVFVCLLLYVPSPNSYGHGGTVSSPNHTFS